MKVHRELNHTENNDVVRAVEKIERFQYEDGSTMPLAKVNHCRLTYLGDNIYNKPVAF